MVEKQSFMRAEDVAKELEVSVLYSADRWFGMTYRADREAVAEELKNLHGQGVYPPTLRR